MYSKIHGSWATVALVKNFFVWWPKIMGSHGSRPHFKSLHGTWSRLHNMLIWSNQCSPSTYLYPLNCYSSTTNVFRSTKNWEMLCNKFWSIKMQFSVENFCSIIICCSALKNYQYMPTGQWSASDELNEIAKIWWNWNLHLITYEIL